MRRCGRMWSEQLLSGGCRRQGCHGCDVGRRVRWAGVQRSAPVYANNGSEDATFARTQRRRDRGPACGRRGPGGERPARRRTLATCSPWRDLRRLTPPALGWQQLDLRKPGSTPEDRTREHQQNARQGEDRTEQTRGWRSASRRLRPCVPTRRAPQRAPASIRSAAVKAPRARAAAADSSAPGRRRRRRSQGRA